ncbi:MAG: HlyD family efflux transporter periplasmic adaptor subunit [Oscillospiraceae bacterium]|nr:HlyD family efflux transporter periplasmic adaptor subunit [Oscillospiraceae bacterium]
MEKEKSLLRNIKSKIKVKKLIVPAVVLAVAAGVIFVREGRDGMPTGGDMPMTMGVRTTVLQLSTLTDSVSVTGTVESTQTVNVTSTVTGAAISEILVQAGDKVSAGDVIAKLDTADILENIEKVKEKLTDNITRAQEKYDRAVTDMNEAYDAAADAEEEYNTAVYWQNVCNTNFEAAKAAVSMQQTAYNTAAAELTAATNDKNNATARYNTAFAEWQSRDSVKTNEQAALEAAQTEYESVMADREATEEAKTAAQTALDDATTRLANAEASLANAQTALDTAAAALQTATERYDVAQGVVNGDENTTGSKASLDAAKQNADYNKIESEYNNAVRLRENARTTLDNKEKAYSNAVTACENAKDSLENASTSDELERLYEDYNDCIITAAISGTVTKINAQVGDVTGGNNSVIAVIEDTENLKISTSFQEYDVQDIKIGMKCVITSDANDKQLSGYVSQISPVASTAGMGSSDVTFSGEITINGTDHGLLIGMNAKAEVILSSTDDVYVVPYDAVGTNESGEKVVYVQNGEDFDPVVVTTGMETDYYIEISSSELKEGMVIRSSADADRSESMVFTEDGEEAENSGMGFGMGGMTGMPSGGNMPQGGNMPDRGGMQGGPGGRG